jgi:hypothetical protein
VAAVCGFCSAADVEPMADGGLRRLARLLDSVRLFAALVGALLGCRLLGVDLGLALGWPLGGRALDFASGRNAFVIARGISVDRNHHGGAPLKKS